MRISVIILLLAVGGTQAAHGYEETRNLVLDADGIGTVEFEVGAGSLEVLGVPGADEISVTAVITVSEDDEDKARRKIESDMTLWLERRGDSAELMAHFDNGFSWGESPTIDLEVRLPEGMHLVIDDGSGSISIENVRGDITLDDGSGSITMTQVGGRVEIDDGSGSIDVSGVGGDISINDGSGSIEVRGVAGSVTVDDGSGSIDVSDVENDLVIVDDGSGDLDYSNIGGRVIEDT